MYLVAKFGLISIVRNSLIMREECTHQQFLPNNGCKSHRALLTGLILAEGAASSAARWWVNVLLVQVCKENHDPDGHWYLETAQVFSCSSIEQLSREGVLLSLPLHAVKARKWPVRKPGISVLNQVTLHWDQFSDLSLHGREKHLCRHRGREHKQPSGEHGGTGNPFWLQNRLLPA